MEVKFSQVDSPQITLIAPLKHFVFKVVIYFFLNPVSSKATPIDWEKEEEPFRERIIIVKGINNI